MSTTLRRGASLPLLAVLALGLGACGSESSDSSAPEASDSSSAGASASVPPGTPDCSTVWHDGGTIPRGYRGCADDTGAFVRKDGLGCESGQVIIRFGDRFYGVAGGTVHETSASLQSDKGYRAAVIRCRA
jgi:hypothetical protein